MLMDSCTIATKIWLLISSALVLAVEVSIGAVRAPYTARHFALPLTVRTSADAVCTYMHECTFRFKCDDSSKTNVIVLTLWNVVNRWYQLYIP